MIWSKLFNRVKCVRNQEKLHGRERCVHWDANNSFTFKYRSSTVCILAAYVILIRIHIHPKNRIITSCREIALFLQPFAFFFQIWTKLKWLHRQSSSNRCFNSSWPRSVNFLLFCVLFMCDHASVFLKFQIQTSNGNALLSVWEILCK